MHGVRVPMWQTQSAGPVRTAHMSVLWLWTLCHTTQHGTVLIIFRLNLQTITITQMLSSGGQGDSRQWLFHLSLQDVNTAGDNVKVITCRILIWNSLSPLRRFWCSNKKKKNIYNAHISKALSMNRRWVRERSRIHPEDAELICFVSVHCVVSAVGQF